MSDYPSNLPPPAAQPKTDGLATTSMVLGIVGLVGMCVCIGPLFAIPAIVCGAIALNRISKSNGTLGGRSQAIAGLVTGILGLVLIPVAAAMTLPALQKAKYSAMLSNCTSNIRQIEMACFQYAENHQGQLPPDLETLQATGLISPNILKCPMHGASKPIPGPSYLYFGNGLKTRDIDNCTILITESNPFHGPKRFNIGFGDGHVEGVAFPQGTTLADLAKQNGWKILAIPKQ
jgi:prepilin-type processing-associated H-X9-DG protein